MAEVSPEKVYEKTLKVRSQQKNDTKANWDKATNFAPLKGEITVYSDENKIKIGDGSTKVTALPYLDAQNAEAMHCYTTSGTAGVWTVSIPGITELKEGLTIKIRLGVASSSSNTLNVNELGAKKVYLNYGTNLIRQYDTNSILSLTYTEQATSSGTDKTGWVIESAYYSTPTLNYLTPSTYQPKTKSILYGYHLCFVNKDGLLIPVNNTSGNTSTTKTLTTEEFDLTQPILYYGSSSTIQANANIYGGLYYFNSYVDLRYSFNTGATLTAKTDVYLKVSRNGNYFKLASGNPIVQTLPTSGTDGYVYVYLGFAMDTYRIMLALEHPMYRIMSGVKRPYDYATYAKVGASTTSKVTGITAALDSTPTFTGTAHHHTYNKAKFSFNTSTRDLTLGFDSTNSGDTTATGSVSKPNVTITDNGHTHTLN